MRISVSRSRRGFPSFASSRSSSCLRHGSIRRSGWWSRLYRNSVACERTTLRTTFRDTRNSRQIALIGFSWTKSARRIFAMVSTISSPKPAPMSAMEATVDPPSPGSRLNADHPENGVLIPCRFTPSHPAGRLALLQEPCLVHHQDGIRFGKRLDHVRTHNIAQRVGIPAAPPQDRLLPPGTGVTCCLGAHPACLAPLLSKQPINKQTGRRRHPFLREQGAHPRLHLPQRCRPQLQRFLD